MKASDLIVFPALSSPLIYSLLTMLSLLTFIHPFLIVGVASLIAIPVTKYSTEAIVSSIYVPALVCFGFLLLGNPEFLLNLAAGYLLAVPLFLVSSFYNEKPQSLVTAHMGGLLVSIHLLSSMGQGPMDARDIFGVLIGIGGRIAGGGGYSPTPIQAFLIAISLAALIWKMTDRLKPMRPSILSYGEGLSAILISAAFALGLAIASRILEQISWFLALSIGLAATLYLVIYPRIQR